MNLLVANTKGGTGKTNTAVQLALYLTLKGKKVLLVDGDEQGSAWKAIRDRSDLGIEPELACVAFPDPKQLRSQTKNLSPNFEHIIMDVGGRVTKNLRAGLMVADVVLVPLRPRDVDIRALENLKPLLEDARDELDAKFLSFGFISCADPQGTLGSDNERTAEEIKNSGFLQYLDAPLGNRKAFASSSGFGISVWEAKNRDKKACQEIEELAKRIFGENLDNQI